MGRLRILSSCFIPSAGKGAAELSKGLFDGRHSRFLGARRDVSVEGGVGVLDLAACLGIHLTESHRLMLKRGLLLL